MEIFEHAFMRLAFLGGTLIAILAPVIGVFLVLRRYSLIGDGLGHIAFSGIAIGLVSKLEPFWVSLGTAVLAALGIERLRASGRLSGDTAIAIFLSTGLALGLVLAKIAKHSTNKLWGYLFGSIITISWADVWITSLIALIVLSTVFALRRQFFYITFDEETARASGLKVSWLNSLFVVLAALTIVAAIPIVGLLLISALIVIPVAASLQIARNFRQTLFFSIICSLISVYGGLFAAYYIDIPPGPTIVLTAVSLFALTGIAGYLQRRARDFNVAEH
jgi:zinc transport system permease protein